MVNTEIPEITLELIRLGEAERIEAAVLSLPQKLTSEEQEEIAHLTTVLKNLEGYGDMS